MNLFKYVFWGFGISFLGSIPLGYLNVIGLQIYQQSGLSALCGYLLGVISVELVMLYLTYKGVVFLSKQLQMARFIELFSIVFLLILAFVFWQNSSVIAHKNGVFNKPFAGSYFATGIVLNLLNFMQIPFWLGWHLFVNKSGVLSRSQRNVYFSGALTGTFCGMFLLIAVLAHFVSGSLWIQKYFLTSFVPAFFLLMAGYQIYSFQKKYFFH